MQITDNVLVQNSTKEKPVLEQTSWIKVNKQCHTLVDEDYKVVAVVFTSYDEDDGDENLIWDAEIEGEEFGSYVSLYMAKLAIQKAIADWDAKLRVELKKKSEFKKKTTKKIAVKKKAVSKKK